MEIHRSDAIVLGVADYREADRLVTLFCRDLGKIRGVARGAKRSIRRFGGALESFALLSVELVPSEGLAQLRSADIGTIFPAIRRDLPKIALAGYACELVESLVPEGMPYPRLFRLLVAYLERLDSAAATRSDRRFFEINLLNILGYRPPLDECGRCGVGLAGRERLFAGAGGMVCCERCGAGGRPLSPVAVAQLIRALGTGRFGVVEFADGDLAGTRFLLDQLIAQHLHRPLKSLPFLREMAGEE
jgi:DNA repair protein RecO (recombination protein O)